MAKYLFTSESVSEGHPDKIADQISDKILDEILKQDPKGRVACETFIKTGLVMVGGEIKTSAMIDVETITRAMIKEIGYDCPKLGFDSESCAVLSVLGKQSTDINQGVDKIDQTLMGAGDQGIMFGYATNETDNLMPAPICYAHKLMERQAEARKNNEISWLRPDAKSQITFIYDNNQIVGIDNIVISTQHDPDIENKLLKEAVMEDIIYKAIPKKWITKDTKYHINPTGRFVIGGPVGDCGLTGRKIIVDTYGGFARHGGGAFSGKDPSKVDRSAAYMARYIAKNIVAAKIADKCEIQLSYAIGYHEPTSIYINTFNTGIIEDYKIIEIIKKIFNLTPFGIINHLQLEQPIYLKTAAYGHFGKSEFSWEKLDKVSDLKNELT